MHMIHVSVKDKVAMQTDRTVYVCGNSDYTVYFAFDEEWADSKVKTARFTYDGQYQDVVFEGTECPVPVIENTWLFRVGVYAGNLKTTTAATVSCKKSILCGSGLPAAPMDDVYAQLMELINGMAGGGASAEDIRKAVADYMAEHPVEVDATLTQHGMAADAAAVGERIDGLSEEIAPVTAVKVLFEDAIVNRESANLFKPEYVRSSRYDYTTGNVYWNTSTSIRNANPVKVSGNTQYSFQEFQGEKQSVSFFFYDASGVIIGEHLKGDRFTHFTTPANAVNLNFHIGAWDTNHPDEEPMVMIWKTDSADKRTEFIPFVEGGLVESVELPKLVVPEVKANGDSILAMKKASFDYGFNYIAYSKISGEPNSINTAEHFEHCAKLPFDMLKGDVRPTADGGVIMCHDAGFTLDDNGDIIAFNADNCTLITDLTEAECLALKHAATGNYVCNLEKFLSICKRFGKVAYITVRDEQIADVVAPVMFRLLDKYHMRTRCIANSFTTASLQAVRAMDEYIMLSKMSTYADGTRGITKAFVDEAISLGNCRVGVFCFASSSADVSPLDPSAEAIAYAIENDVRVDAAIAPGISITDLMAKGVTGAHLTVAPVID